MMKMLSACVYRRPIMAVCVPLLSVQLLEHHCAILNVGVSVCLFVCYGTNTALTYTGRALQLAAHRKHTDIERVRGEQMETNK